MMLICSRKVGFGPSPLVQNIQNGQTVDGVGLPQEPDVLLLMLGAPAVAVQECAAAVTVFQAIQEHGLENVSA